LRAHAGITYEPVMHVKVSDGEVFVTLEAGPLGIDPFKTWNSLLSHAATRRPSLAYHAKTNQHTTPLDPDYRDIDELRI